MVDGSDSCALFRHRDVGIATVHVRARGRLRDPVSWLPSEVGIQSPPAVIEVLRRQHWLLMMGMVSGDNRVGGEVYRCLLPILWHDNHT